jgi:hypothetical protein
MRMELCCCDSHNQQLLSDASILLVDPQQKEKLTRAATHTGG